MDPLLYAMLVIFAAGAVVALGGLIVMWRNR
jgi:hypothetical protein